MITRLLATALVAAAASSAATAQPAPPAEPASAAVASPAAPVEPKVIASTIEDDNIRIEELRVRGESRRLVVRQKNNPLPSYEIVPAEGGRDPSQRTRSAAGQRVWNVLSF